MTKKQIAVLYIIHIAMVSFVPVDDTMSDQARYRTEAKNLLRYGTFSMVVPPEPTAWDGPIYACFLVPFVAIFDEGMTPPVQMIQSVVSLLTAMCVISKETVLFLRFVAHLCLPVFMAATGLIYCGIYWYLKRHLDG